MTRRKKIAWARLDNASKIFPSTCNQKDTKVFRLSCELYQPIQQDILQKALNLTIEDFPLYKSILRRGVFWYYLEASDITPEVSEESLPLCAPIFYKGKKRLLYRVFYYKNRIHLEVFHALSDGTGALWFLQTLTTHYLTLIHSNISGRTFPNLGYYGSISEKMDDSFGKHYKGSKRQVQSSDEKVHSKKSYHIRGTSLDEHRMKLIEGTMSVKSVLEIAHEYNTTMTIFITSLFIYSIYKGMPSRSKSKPIVLSIPVNLRHYFESATARNFFSTMNIGWSLDKDTVDIVDIIAYVSKNFQKELTPSELNERLEQFMSLERNMFARIIPLPLKDLTLKIATKIKDRGITTSISNLGAITMPAELGSDIHQFCFSTSARRPQICMCSYQDKLVISFTSPYQETEIQKTFFQWFSQRGIPIVIGTNQTWEGGN